MRCELEAAPFFRAIRDPRKLRNDQRTRMACALVVRPPRHGGTRCIASSEQFRAHAQRDPGTRAHTAPNEPGRALIQTNPALGWPRIMAIRMNRAFAHPNEPSRAPRPNEPSRGIPHAVATRTNEILARPGACGCVPPNEPKPWAAHSSPGWRVHRIQTNPADGSARTIAIGAARSPNEPGPRNRPNEPGRALDGAAAAAHLGSVLNSPRSTR